MQRNRIFGTPPQPVFNMVTSGLTPELLEEMLYVLAEENEKNMDCVNERKGYFKTGQSAGRGFVLIFHRRWITEIGQCVFLFLICFLRIFLSEYIFLLCQELELPTETRFQAIELFDKYVELT